MSYCRWSSDRFQCDVYCYESVYDGYVVHVASSRDPEDNLAPLFPIYSLEELLHVSDDELSEVRSKYEREYAEWSARREDPDYPKIMLKDVSPQFAGTSHYRATARECAALLMEIRESGLNVPQYAIDALIEDADAGEQRAS